MGHAAGVFSHNHKEHNDNVPQRDKNAKIAQISDEFDGFVACNARAMALVRCSDAGTRRDCVMSNAVPSSVLRNITNTHYF